MYEQHKKIYDQLVAMNPNFERKGKTMPYTSANGHMFSQLNKDGQIGIRLSKELGQEFMEKYNAVPFLSYGAKMRGYVCVPDDMLTDLDTLSHYLQKGYECVLSLEPK